jgi:hypothetical protein
MRSEIRQRIFFGLIYILLIGNSNFIFAQNESSFKKLRQLPCPEKCWVMKHPFIAKKAWKLTQQSLHVTDSILSCGIIGKDANGGKVDAFRHAFWMALVSQKIGKRRALSLGKAHENSNYRDYKKHRKEEGTVPDKISSDMDLWNNKLGADLGASSRKTENKTIQQMIIQAINDGMLKIIKKNQTGQFLDANGNIIDPKELNGKWKNNKCLVNSNYL